MFGKLMKAEWRASRRVIGALCAVVLISGALLGLWAMSCCGKEPAVGSCRIL